MPYCKFGKKIIMAKVISPFKISGTVADLTFRQTQDGGVVQRKPGPSREQVLNSKKFKFTRQHAGIFRKVIKDGKLLRDALHEAIHSVRHAKLNGMMNKLLYAMAKTDTRSKRPCRHAAAGDISLLEGFEFNNKRSLDQALPIKFTHSLDPVTGTMQVALPAFIARKKKALPEGATHFRVVSCAAAVDFVNGSYREHSHTTSLLPLSKQIPEAIQWEHQLEAVSGEILLHVLAIEFYKVESGKTILLKWGAAKILDAARVEAAAPESSKPALQHTISPNKVVDPYATMDYDELINRVFRQQPVGSHLFFTMGQ
jgi:hypothetical protein